MTNRGFIGERSRDRALDERERAAVRQRESRVARPGVERRDVRHAAIAQPAPVRREARMLEGTGGLHDADSQRPPAADITMTTTTRIASTSSAIFHGLFGYSPWIAPVTPFCTHWKLRAPYV